MSISPTVRRASSFKELLAIPGGDGPYRFTTIFRESDWRERRRSKKKFKLLKRIDGEIRETMRNGEKVFFFTPGRGLSFWERWVVGWRRVLVVTNRRLVLLQTDARGFPRTLRAQVGYGGIQRVEAEGRSRIRIGLRNGKSLVLRGITPADRDFLCDALRKAVAKDTEEVGASGLEELCPHCHAPVEGRPRRCYRCRRRFKRPWLAALLSLVVPGLGNRYLGHRGFATLEFLGAAAIWLAYWVGSGLWGFPGVPEVIQTEWVFAAVHGTDALWTWYVARRGVYATPSA